MANYLIDNRLRATPHAGHWLTGGGVHLIPLQAVTFQSDTGGTFHSDTPGTFESDMDGTFKVSQSDSADDGVETVLSFRKKHLQ